MLTNIVIILTSTIITLCVFAEYCQSFVWINNSNSYLLISLPLNWSVADKTANLEGKKHTFHKVFFCLVLICRSKEEPFFGNSVLCASEDELHKWIGAMVIGEHPEGLSPIIV